MGFNPSIFSFDIYPLPSNLLQMQRRKFIQNIGLAGFAIGLAPASGLANLLPQETAGFLIPLGEAQTQIRHGALNIPLGLKENSTMPFDWLLQVHRNIFFKNGFQSSGGMDLEIISVLLKEEEDLEAIQIQLSTEETTVMVKDQLVALGRKEVFQEVGMMDETTQLVIGDLSATKVYDFPLAESKSVFVQLLEGAISCNDQVLDLNTGLALEAGKELHFKATLDSRVLILMR